MVFVGVLFIVALFLAAVRSAIKRLETEESSPESPRRAPPET